ncbi:hypothetical protein ABW20_dc0101982 [Dactylellina cionopaga]|nr:hypothetical protein ABW20_dc0101982 [Dactylellina cionopaga]
MRHYANLIVNAEKSIILATNFWAASAASHIITDALRELSRRRLEAGLPPVDVKILYDRGNVKQTIKNHLEVGEKEFNSDKVQIPRPDEVKGLTLQVVNFHIPPVGTFHAKWMVVDGRVAILNSNNIQVALSHLSGPSGDGNQGGGQFDNAQTRLNPEIDSQPANGHPGPMGMGGSPAVDPVERPAESGATTPPKASNTGHIGRAIATEENQDEAAKVLDQDDDSQSSDRMLATKSDAFRVEYDATFSAEAERVRGFLGTVEKVTKHLNTSIQPNTTGTLLDSDIAAHIEQFSPYILLPRHKPFPIAMVNRRPFGAPGHQSVKVPQNEAWTAAIRLAEKQVFIQTPDLNASALVEELPKAVQRGIEVVLYLTLGYNDANGTNEQIVCSLFSSLSSEEEKERLKVYWYTAKDMRSPVHAKTKQRTSHIKLMVVDGHIGIQGSGNQDTQSWYHSQETNVMIDSKKVVQEWLWGIRSNQNTHIWGRVDNDGCWKMREERDHVAEGGSMGDGIPGAMGGGKISFGWAKGIKGAIERVQGAGGF